MKRLILFLFVFMTISGAQELMAQSPWPLVPSTEALNRLSDSGEAQKATISVLSPSDPAYAEQMRKLEVYYAVCRSLMNDPNLSVDNAIMMGVGTVYGGGLISTAGAVTQGVESKNLTSELFGLLKL